eukprot:1161727-Pelagomonas_calceolata.AAC.18
MQQWSQPKQPFWHPPPNCSLNLRAALPQAEAPGVHAWSIMGGAMLARLFPSLTSILAQVPSFHASTTKVLLLPSLPRCPASAPAQQKFSHFHSCPGAQLLCKY